MVKEKVFYDKLDCFILTKIYESGKKGKEITTWEIAKLFDWEDKPFFEFNQDRFYNAKNTLVTHRISHMAERGIIIIKKNSLKRIFEIPTKRLIICKHRFPDKKYYKTLCVREKDRWIAVQI